MGINYSYTQPSESEDYYGNIDDSAYSKTEELIRQDQAELGHNVDHAEPVQYPPQPEVEFGFPQTCYCGARPFLATSYSVNDPGRRYYTCANVDDGDCHVWKWWDVAVMEEMRARDKHVLQLAEKVDTLTYSTSLDTDQKLVTLEKQVGELVRQKQRFTNDFELAVAVVFLLVVCLGLVVML